MMTREEKNKKIVDEIKREEIGKVIKKILLILGIIFLLFTLLFTYMYFIGTKGFKTQEYIIQDENIPEVFHGVKILHFSDLLYGSTINEKDLVKLENEIKKINPNLVVFTGGLISDEYHLTENDKEKIQQFLKKIPFTIGKYAIKGHTDTATFDLVMENTDFIVLDNEVTSLYNNSDEKINLMGINNQVVSCDDHYTIALINNYDNYHNYHIKANLVLAGDNLGGEIRLFGQGLLGDNLYKDTYYQENNTHIYISNGLGSKTHLRLFNKPSINVYRLYHK